MSEPVFDAMASTVAAIKKVAAFDEQQRLVKLVEALPFMWVGTDKRLEIDKDDLVALLKGETK